MSAFQLTYKPYGDHSILVEWPPIINEKVLQDILKFKKNLYDKSFKLKFEVKTAYTSLLITYGDTIDNINSEVSILKSLYLSQKPTKKGPHKLWKIPVCYDQDFAIDLDEISNRKKLSKQDAIRLHSDAFYIVYFIGFLPGFLYLGGLDERLACPRKSTPRQHIEKGAVAIGGNQTGIYPNASPGGWNIIGNTPISFFDASQEIPCFANPGDKIKFIPIGLEKYRNISTLVKAGVYQMESEVIGG